MDLPIELVNQFAKMMNTSSDSKKEETLYGTASITNGKVYVQIDGSSDLTPAATTAVVQNGERVTVIIKNHSAMITGNTSSPAVRAADLETTNDNVSELDEAKANTDLSNVPDHTITTEKIGLGVITVEQLAIGAVTEDKIALGAICADKLNLSTHILT